MLSRVEEMEQVFILQSLPEEKIRASAKALTELEEMNSRSINKNPIPWKEKSESFIKISSVNCMNLNNNFEDILNDPTLMESSLLTLSETWLEQGLNFNINGFKSHFNSVGPGKGLSFFYKDSIFTPTMEVKEDNMQLTTMESMTLEVITVYRSEKDNLSALVEHVKTMIKSGVTTVVFGDFNICYLSNKNNKLRKYRERVGFSQLIKEATHMKGRLLDHMYFQPAD